MKSIKANPNSAKGPDKGKILNNHQTNKQTNNIK
jgi:hypothetical protein